MTDERAELLATIRYALGRGDNTVYADEALEKAADYIGQTSPVEAAPARYAEADGFEEWFRAIWAGSDDTPVPEYQSSDWREYMDQRSLARGAWNEAWHQSTNRVPPVDAAVERDALRSAIESLQEFKPAAQKSPGVSKGFVTYMAKKHPTITGEEYGWLNKGDVLAALTAQQQESGL